MASGTGGSGEGLWFFKGQATGSLAMLDLISFFLFFSFVFGVVTRAGTWVDQEVNVIEVHYMTFPNNQ